MSDMDQVAETVLAAKLIGDAVKEHGAPARAQLGRMLAEAGIERKAVTHANGTKLGTVSLGAGKPSARVVNEAAFARYVAENYPSAIVPVVDPDFRRDLLATLAKNGTVNDPNTKPPMPIPGVDLTAGDPYPIARPTAEGKARMHQLLAASGLLAIESGASDE